MVTAQHMATLTLGLAPCGGVTQLRQQPLLASTVQWLAPHSPNNGSIAGNATHKGSGDINNYIIPLLKMLPYQTVTNHENKDHNLKESVQGFHVVHNWTPPPPPLITLTHGFPVILIDGFGGTSHRSPGPLQSSTITYP